MRYEHSASGATSAAVSERAADDLTAEPPEPRHRGANHTITRVSICLPASCEVGNLTRVCATMISKTGRCEKSETGEE